MTSDPVISRAQAGDEQAFAELAGRHRRELQLHCYRLLGSAQDAEDMLQETLLAAWRGLPAFEGRASVRSWLFRIATSRCLTALRDSGRRPKEVPMPSTEQPMPSRSEPVWLQPYPDALLDLADRAPGPEARYDTREAIELAFIVGLQRLPPLQRVTLVLRDVLSFRTAEVAGMLDTTEVAVKSALQRARATLDAELPRRDRERAALPNSARERAVTSRFADAIERGDVEDIVAVLSDDVRLVTPPERVEYLGRAAIADHLRPRATPLRVLLTRANTQPALACYFPDPHVPIARAYGLMVLSVRDDEISVVTWFPDTAVFPLFGLPRSVHR